MEKIVPGKYVSLVYDLYETSDQGQDEKLVHQSDPSDPEVIIFGVTQGVVPPLEKALEGLQQGDKFDVVASPEESFGPYLQDNIVTLDREVFMVDGKFDSDMVAPGKAVPMMTADGMRIMGIVKEVNDKNVTMDFNHPLAGKHVRFKGSVLEVREPSEQELHIATGGCGCNCSGGDCGDGCGSDCNEGDCCCSK